MIGARAGLPGDEWERARAKMGDLIETLPDDPRLRPAS